MQIIKKSDSAYKIAIGIDCGTSGIRAVALTNSQHIIAQAQRPLHEQTPQHWWQQCLSVLDQLLTELSQSIELNQHKLVLSLDATSSSLFLINRQGEPLSPVMMYYDQCPQQAAQVAEQLTAQSGAHGAQSSLAKAIYLKQELSKDSVQSVEKQDWLICHQADWLIYQLTGQIGISDENNCLKLGYDPQHRQWENCTRRYFNQQQLPQVFPAGHTIGQLKTELEARWQLQQPIIVHAGTTDSIAAFIAAGGQQLGDAVISLGSTLAFKLLSKQPIVDVQQGIYSHRLGDSWLVGGASNAGGASLLHHFSLPQLQQLSLLPIDRRNQKLPSIVELQHNYPLPAHCQTERFPRFEQVTAMSLQANSNDLIAKQQFQQLLLALVAVEQLAWQALTTASQQPIKRLLTVGGGTHNLAWQQLRRQQLSYRQDKAFSEDAAVGSALLALSNSTLPN